MIELQNIGVDFGGEWLFKDVTWNIGDADRIGLIGANGTGKTTLLRIIAGQVAQSTGKVIKTKDCTIGYLPQESVTLHGRPLYDEMLSALAPIHALFDKKQSLEKEMSQLPQEALQSELLKRYGDIEDEIVKKDGYTIENQIEKILSGLGFKKEDWHKPTETFSGGWEMRIALGKLLLQDPDYLLLDEPTNFLDIESMIWLENYLKTFPGAIILVSHDRYFMDKLVKKITELELGQLLHYRTNYSGYTEAKDKRRAAVLKAYQDQQEEIAKIKTFIAKFRANARRARQVQSRIKMLEKMKLVVIPPQPKKVKFKFPPAPRSGDKVLEMRGVSKAYDGKKVFENVNLFIQRCDRIAIVGVNGAGKTTLLKIMTGVLQSTQGTAKIGANVRIGYFAQRTLEMLNPQNTVLEEMRSAAPLEQEGILRGILGNFLFTDDDVFKPVNILSGGEKTRLAIAKIMLQPINLLILDEPTNHLDLAGRKVLEQALHAYKETLIIVTHDRLMIDKVASKVIEVADGKIKVYPGNYTEFMLSKTALSAERLGLKAGATEKKKAKRATEGTEKKIKKKERKKPKLKQVVKSLVEEMLDEAEAGYREMIEEKKRKLAKLEKLLTEPEVYSDHEKLKDITVEYQLLQQEIEKLERERHRTRSFD